MPRLSSELVLPKIEECFFRTNEEIPRSTLWKQILMKWVYHKGKTKSRFYHENFDPTGKYNCKSIFLLKIVKRVLFRPVILYRAVWSKHGRRVRFQTKNLPIQEVGFAENQGFGLKIGPIPKMKWWMMMPDIKSIHWNVPNPLSHWLDAVRGPTNGSGRGTRSNGPRISVQPLEYNFW